MTSREQASRVPAKALRGGGTRWLRGAAVGLLLTLIVLASRRAAWSHPGSSDALVWPAEVATVIAGVALAAGVVLLLALVHWLAPWRRRGDPADPPLAARRIRPGVRGWAALGLIAIAVVCTVAVAIGELGRREARPTTPGPVGVGRAPHREPASPVPGPAGPHRARRPADRRRCAAGRSVACGGRRSVASLCDGRRSSRARGWHDANRESFRSPGQPMRGSPRSPPTGERSCCSAPRACRATRPRVRASTLRASPRSGAEVGSRWTC